MCFAKMIEVFSTVRMRLTIIVVAALMMSTAITFVVLHHWLSDALATRLDNALTSEWAEFEEIYRDGGAEALQKEFRFEQKAVGPFGGFMCVYTDHGVAYGSGPLDDWGIATQPKWSPAEIGARTPMLDDAIGAPNGVRVRRLHGKLEPGIAVLMAYSQRPNDELLQDYRRGFMFAFTAILLPVLLSAWLIARHAMQGVESVTRTAADIVTGKTSQRVDVHGQGREIQALGETFNAMLDHVFKVVRELKEINDNIAHDLRTPLTRIRTETERLAAADEASPQVAQIAAELMTEIDDLLHIINTMLDISEMEAGVRNLALEDLELGDLVRDACDLYHPAAEDAHVPLTVHANGAARIKGDRQLIRRAICNLLDNAIKYSTEGAPITVRVNTPGNECRIEIKDGGVGIPETDLPHVFERFYRGDLTRSTRGNGLGLGLVKAIVTAHNGTVTIDSPSGHGTTVNIAFPSHNTGHPSP